MASGRGARASTWCSSFTGHESLAGGRSRRSTCTSSASRKKMTPSNAPFCSGHLGAMWRTACRALDRPIRQFHDGMGACLRTGGSDISGILALSKASVRGAASSHGCCSTSPVQVVLHVALAEFRSDHRYPAKPDASSETRERVSGDGLRRGSVERRRKVNIPCGGFSTRVMPVLPSGQS